MYDFSDRIDICSIFKEIDNDTRIAFTLSNTAGKEMKNYFNVTVMHLSKGIDDVYKIDVNSPIYLTDNKMKNDIKKVFLEMVTKDNWDKLSNAAVEEEFDPLPEKITDYSLL